VFPGPRWAHLPFLVLTAVPIVVRRRRPLLALIAVGVAQSLWIYGLYPMSQQPPITPFLALVIAVYSAAAYADGTAARAAWITVALGMLSNIPALVAGQSIGYVAGPNVTLLIAFSLGLGFARSRRRAEAEQRRAAQADADRAAAAEQAAAAERARIARELHDVISHDVSLMVLQASVERRVLANERSQTGQALEAIEATGREALAELRRMLGVLRKNADDAAPLRPQPGLATLPALVAQARDAGVDVTLSVDTDLTLPPGLDIAAFRIVQEALTNVAKHAHGAAATVRVSHVGDALDIEITDDGATKADAVLLPSGGHGLIGLRERVALYGGTFLATPRPGGGFRVHVRVPAATV
jgi:signal transduction histidine kinase